MTKEEQDVRDEVLRRIVKFLDNAHTDVDEEDERVLVQLPEGLALDFKRALDSAWREMMVPYAQLSGFLDRGKFHLRRDLAASGAHWLSAFLRERPDVS